MRHTHEQIVRWLLAVTAWGSLGIAAAALLAAGTPLGSAIEGAPAGTILFWLGKAIAIAGGTTLFGVWILATWHAAIVSPWPYSAPRPLVVGVVAITTVLGGLGYYFLGELWRSAPPRGGGRTLVP
jgi:hypothetical protein